MSDLEKFCGEHDGRHILTVPFVVAGFRYACNGTAIAREPAPGEADSVPPEGRVYPRVQQMWQDWCEPTGRLPALSGITQTVMEDCDCQEDCPDCGGTGVCVCPRCDDNHTCGTCGGKGWVPHPTCAQCGGDGFIPVLVPAPQRVGKSWISGTYAAMLHSLPQPVVIGPQDQEDRPISFRCQGLEGVIAPTRLSLEDQQRYAPVSREPIQAGERTC